MASSEFATSEERNIVEKETVELLRELVKWTRASSYPAVYEALRRALPDAKTRLIYQLTDGQHSREEIRIRTKAGTGTIQQLWKRCISMGLMDEDAHGRKVRAFDLRDFGLLVEDEITETKDE